MFADIEEARKALDRVDAVLFQAQTGQIQLTEELWDDEEALGNSIVEWLADALSALTPKSKEEVIADFTKIRSLNHMKMTAELYLQLYPKSKPEADELIRRMFDPDNPMPQEEVGREWTRFFGFMFVERPQTKRGFLKSLFGR